MLVTSSNPTFTASISPLALRIASSSALRDRRATTASLSDIAAHRKAPRCNKGHSTVSVEVHARINVQSSTDTG